MDQTDRFVGRACETDDAMFGGQRRPRVGRYRQLVRAVVLATSIATAVVVVDPPAAAAPDPVAGSIPVQFGSGYPFRIFDAVGATAGNPVPLVLFLHGDGETGTDNTKQVVANIGPLIDAVASGEHSAYLVAPQTPVPAWDVNQLKALIDGLIADDTRHIDPDRIYVTGLSRGGEGTNDLAAAYPNVVAAAAPLSAIEVAPSKWSVMAMVPTWAFHGTDDPYLPQYQPTAQYMLANDARFRLTIRSGWGHDSWDRVYVEDPAFTGAYTGDTTDVASAGLYDWMFAQRLSNRGRPSPARMRAGEQINIDLGRFDSLTQRSVAAPDVWVNVADVADGRRATSVPTTTGRRTTTNIDLAVSGRTAGAPSLQAGGTTTGNVVPVSAATDSMVLAGAQTATFTISGLAPGALHEIALFSSGSEPGSSTGLSVGSVARVVVSTGNATRQVRIPTIASTDGTIQVRVTVANGATGYVNAMSIRNMATADEVAANPWFGDIPPAGPFAKATRVNTPTP
jgi:predicted esterase